MGLLQDHMHAKFKAFRTASSQSPDHSTPPRQPQGTGLHCRGIFGVFCRLELWGESSCLTITQSNKKKGAEHKKSSQI